jgi:hypothetical protein
MHPPVHARIDEVERAACIVPVVFEWVGNGFRNNNMPGKVDYCLNVMQGEQSGHELQIPRVSFNEDCLFRDSPTVAGIKIIDHDHIATGIDQLSACMGPDIAGSSGNEDISVFQKTQGRHGFFLAEE